MKDIRMSYQRSLSSNYLKLEPEGELVKDFLLLYSYDIGILEHNHIKGLLRSAVSMEDGKVNIYYDISSMQPFDRLLEIRSIGVREIKSVIYSLVRICTEIKKYLLDENFILLDLNCIYSDMNLENIYFCYIPNLYGNALEGTRKLLERLLLYVDKNDKEALLMAYSLHQESGREDFTLKNLVQRLTEISSDGKKNPEQVKRADEEDESGTADTERTVQKAKVYMNTATTDENRDERGKSFLHKLFGKNKKEMFRGKISNDTEENWMEYIRLDCREENNDLTVMKEEEDVCMHTALLTQEDKKAQYILKSVSDGEDIPIKYFPFIIGKQNRVCDYVLDSPGVSRMHLKIDKEDNRVIAFDLNSRNGTRISGVLLGNEESTVLNENDEIDLVGNKFILRKINY